MPGRTGTLRSLHMGYLSIGGHPIERMGGQTRVVRSGMDVDKAESGGFS